MFYNLKIAIRNLRSNGLYSIINIAGLAISLCVAIFILLWVSDELSYDKFHKRGKDIYQTIATLNMDGKDLFWKTSSSPLGIYSKEAIPEIEKFSRVKPGFSSSISYNDNHIGEVGSMMVDSTFFSIFDFPLLEGSVSNPFTDRYSIILSRHLASVLFGDEDALGKTVRVDGNKDFHVTAIMEDMPKNTFFQADVIYTYNLMKEYQSEAELSHWGNLGILTFFLLNPDANAQEVAKRITEIQQQNFPDVKITYLLQPLFKNRFYEADGQPTANMQASRLFTVAVFILLTIACINYVNLVTARFTKRNKELFVKKVLGAKKNALFRQSMTESILLFFIAMIVATVLLFLLFPVFKTISGKEMSFQFFNLNTLIIFLLTFIIVTVLAGIFPAISLSTGKPLQLIRENKGKKHGFLFFRRSLVVLQFVAATVLILGAIVINKQIHFIQKKELGYNRKNILSVTLSNNAASQYENMKTDLSRQPGVLGVTSSSENILSVQSASGWGEKAEEMLMIGFLSVDKDFIPTMNIQLTEGANFTGTPADSAYVILNETALAKTGITNPIGRNFELNRKRSIIGIMKDFNFQDLHKKIEPLVLYVSNKPSLMYVKIAPQSASHVISALESSWKQRLPGVSFEYRFLDDEFDKLYKSDIRTGNLFNVFAMIAILISCLGLFGLVSYTAETKTKEIGIRKVLGASVSNIVNMLSKEFLLLVGIAMFIAFPLAYYWLNKMLQAYAYRISMDWWMFALAGIITVMLTLLTVGWQAIKAATANPVKSIKTE